MKILNRSRSARSSKAAVSRSTILFRRDPIAVRAVINSCVMDSKRASSADMKIRFHVAGEVTEGDDWEERGRRSAVLSLGSYC